MGRSKYKAVKIDGVKHDYHRWLMEQKVGRKLGSDEIVHHLNENKLDNDINNLQIMTRAEHARLHAKTPYFSEKARERAREYLSGRPAFNRKLTEEDVTFIKDHYTPRDVDYGARALARKYGVDHTSILNIVKGKFYTSFD